MEILKLEVSIVTDTIKSIFLILIVIGVLSLIFKSKINIFEKYLSMFKFIFYLLLATLTYFLNVKVSGNQVTVDWGIPKELTIGQSLLILLSIFEAMSNAITAFKMPKSEFHLVKIEDFSNYKKDVIQEKFKVNSRIAYLEKELKNKNSENKLFKKKKKRGKKRKFK